MFTLMYVHYTYGWTMLSFTLLSLGRSRVAETWDVKNEDLVSQPARQTDPYPTPMVALINTVKASLRTAGR